MNEIRLSGSLLGFEEYKTFVLRDTLGADSPFRTLSCDDTALTFIVVNPFQIFEDYSFELDEGVLDRLGLDSTPVKDMAILCVVRHSKEALYINLRSPLVINTKNGRFAQIVLQDETYGVSVPLAAKNNKP